MRTEKVIETYNKGIKWFFYKHLKRTIFSVVSILVIVVLIMTIKQGLSYSNDHPYKVFLIVLASLIIACSLFLIVVPAKWIQITDQYKSIQRDKKIK